MSRKPFYDHECRRLRACQVLLMSLYGFRREAQTSLASLDAGGVHPENPRELLDVPHILRKLKMRRYEGHFFDQKARAFQSAISLTRLHQTGLREKKRNLAASISDPSWRRLLVALSCCGARDGASRPVLWPFPQRSPHWPGSHHRAHRHQLKALYPGAATE